MTSRSLLVVEDDPDLRRMYRRALAFAGFDVAEAGNGLEALRRIDAALPDLIVLDLMLPVLGGHAVAQEVAAQAHLRHIPIVIVTGSSEQLTYLNSACVLRKPITPEALTDAVRRCLASAAPPAAQL
jgi:CheY-like chemotaxis protein